eukprot:Hpha_TRINITY_DN9370_c0_g1::TRINITY_DN9370_c0_g1_i1::g.26036::m.26036
MGRSRTPSRSPSPGFRSKVEKETKRFCDAAGMRPPIEEDLLDLPIREQEVLLTLWDDRVPGGKVRGTLDRLHNLRRETTKRAIDDFCRQNNLDDRCQDRLESFAGYVVLPVLANVDPQRVNNPNGMVMTLLTKAKLGLERNDERGGPGRATSRDRPAGRNRDRSRDRRRGDSRERRRDDSRDRRRGDSRERRRDDSRDRRRRDDSRDRRGRDDREDRDRRRRDY